MDALSFRSRLSDQDVIGESVECRNTSCLVVLKGVHTWRFHFQAGREEDLVEALIDLSANPVNELDPFQMLTLAWDIARKARQHALPGTKGLYVAKL